MAEDLTDAVHDLRVLVDVARRMGETFELEPLLQAVEHAGRAALSCDRATIFLLDAATDELYSKVATGTGEIRFPAKIGIAGEAAQSGEIILVPDAYADPRFNPDIDRRTGYRTRNMLTLPLRVPEGDVIGVLQVLNKLDGDFTDNDMLLARALGSLAAIAIKRQMLLDEAAIKERLERDLNIARSIQQQLLPKKNPAITGYDVAGWNRPADSTGGDCYDFLPVDETHLAFMIADATGHGIGPALIMVECRALVRAMSDMLQDLSEIAGRVNRLLCDDLPDDRFVTICFGVLDASTHTLNHISAGQGPLLLYRAAENKVYSYPASALPMGVMRDAEMTLADPIVFEPGDMLLLLTDGFTEWSTTEGTLYGDERLAELICRHAGLGCADLIRVIYDDVRAFCRGSAQMDDLTAVLIKRAT